MPEPSLLETLRREHRVECYSRTCVGPHFCLKDGEPWPCPVARYIERAEALAKDFEKAVKQAKMYYDRDWYSSAALTSAAEELAGFDYMDMHDADDIAWYLKRGIAPPLYTKTMEELLASVAALAAYREGTE